MVAAECMSYCMHQAAHLQYVYSLFCPIIHLPDFRRSVTSSSNRLYGALVETDFTKPCPKEPTIPYVWIDLRSTVDASVLLVFAG